MVDRLHHTHSRKGFNLIEAAIVLGVVGLVLGGIWVAAANVNRSIKISRLVSDMLVIVEATHRLVPYANYPTSFGDDVITAFAYKAGIIPSDYRIEESIGYSTGFTPSGIKIVLSLACGWVCPTLVIDIYAGDNFDRSDCINLLQRVVNPMNTSLVYVTGGTEYYSPGDDPAGMDCPSDFGWLTFLYNPN